MRSSLARKCRKASQDRQKREQLAYQETEVPIKGREGANDRSMIKVI
jgi:hypothetical protein